MPQIPHIDVKLFLPTHLSLPSLSLCPSFSLLEASLLLLLLTLLWTGLKFTVASVGHRELARTERGLIGQLSVYASASISHWVSLSVSVCACVCDCVSACISCIPPLLSILGLHICVRVTESPIPVGSFCIHFFTLHFVSSQCPALLGTFQSFATDAYRRVNPQWAIKDGREGWVSVLGQLLPGPWSWRNPRVQGLQGAVVRARPRIRVHFAVQFGLASRHGCVWSLYLSVSLALDWAWCCWNGLSLVQCGITCQQTWWMLTE